tara:strand:+ start:27 stop:380 length:354 start_codon:yes stop_codon:yes gene_type:complete
MKIKDLEVGLEKPASIAACFDVLSAIAENPLRGQAAALGLCSRGPARPPVRLKAASAAGWLEYGGQIVDHYAKQGVGVGDWIEAAREATTLIAEVINGCTEDEVSSKSKNSKEGEDQ